MAGRSASEVRRELARKAFAPTAAYDAAIAEWMAREEARPFPRPSSSPGAWRTGCAMARTRIKRRRSTAPANSRPGVATARQLQGKELSYNNYADADAAFELVAEFGPPAVAIVKHANPCGVAIGATLREAWDKALACDPVSAFRRHRRAQPAARRGHCRGDRPAPHRSRHRPRGR